MTMRQQFVEGMAERRGSIGRSGRSWTAEGGCAT
jgi:hypothetical protein